MEGAIAIITSIVAIFVSISTAIKNFSEAKKNLIPQKVEKQSNINIEIIQLLEEIKELFKADRVQIYDFHNGVELANEVSLMKCSCTYEVVRMGIKAYFKELQNIHLGMIPHFIHELLKQKEMIVNDIEAIKEKMPATYEFKKSQNVGGFYDIILNNRQGKPIGFLGIQYSEVNSIHFSKSEIQMLYKYKVLLEEKKEKMKDKK